MSRTSYARRLVALAVSAMMAFPATGWAKFGDNASDGATKDGLPAFFQEIKLADGQTGYLIGAPIYPSQEAGVVKQLASDETGRTLFAFSNPDDGGFRALSHALSSGHHHFANSFFIAENGQAEILKTPQFAPSVRALAAKTINSVTEFCKRQKYGLMTAFIAAGSATSYIMYQSSSVSAGMQAFVALFGWAVFQGMFTHTWDRYLDGGASKFKKFASTIKRWVSRDATREELTSGEAHVAEVAGKFHASWLANSAVAGYVFLSAGTFESIIGALAYGYIMSYDILDPNVSAKVKEGKWSEKFFINFVRVRILAGAALEFGAFMQFPFAYATLAAITTAGLTYLAVGKHIEIAGASAKEKTRRAAYAAYEMACEKALARTQTKVSAR